jgi:tetratricopeptide (TPR) repeat protein
MIGQSKLRSGPTMKQRNGPDRNDAATHKMLEQAAAALLSGRISEAQEIARNRLTRHPRHPGALQLLGMTLLAQSRPREAVEPLEQAALRSPGAAVETYLAVALRRTGRSAEAVTLLERATEREPTLSQAFYELGTLLYEQRRVAEAEAVLNRGIKLMPGAGDCSLALGTILLDRGELENAAIAFARVLANAPGHSGAPHGLGSAFMGGGEFDRAAAKFRQAIASDPSDTRAQLMLATCLFELGQPEEAIERLRSLLRSAPHLFGGAVKACSEAGRGRLWLKPSAAAECLGLPRQGSPDPMAPPP